MKYFILIFLLCAPLMFALDITIKMTYLTQLHKQVTFSMITDSKFNFAIGDRYSFSFVEGGVLRVSMKGTETVIVDNWEGFSHKTHSEIRPIKSYTGFSYDRSFGSFPAEPEQPNHSLEVKLTFDILELKESGSSTFKFTYTPVNGKPVEVNAPLFIDHLVTNEAHFNIDYSHRKSVPEIAALPFTLNLAPITADTGDLTVQTVDIGFKGTGKDCTVETGMVYTDAVTVVDRFNLVISNRVFSNTKVKLSCPSTLVYVADPAEFDKRHEYFLSATRDGENRPRVYFGNILADGESEDDHKKKMSSYVYVTICMGVIILMSIIAYCVWARKERAKLALRANSHVMDSDDYGTTVVTTQGNNDAVYAQLNN